MHDASRHLINALTPVFIDEEAELTLSIDLANNSYKVFDVLAVSKHQEFLLRAAAKEFLAAVHHLPLIDLVAPVIVIDMGGPRSSVITITYSQKDADSMGFEWDDDFGQALELLSQMFQRIDAVAQQTPCEGEVVEFCVIHDDLQDRRVTMRARTPKQAAYLFVACYEPKAAFKSTFRGIKDVLRKVPRKEWA